jgi:hypothetical protein
MRVTLWTAIGLAALCFGALADDGHGGNNNNNNGGNNGNSSLEAGVVGSAVGQVIGGISSGGAPWVVNEGEASVSADGRVRVEVQGLLIATGGPANLVGTTGPVTMVAASVVCGGTGGLPVSVPDTAITPSPLSSRGDAHIDQRVTLPAVCIGPVVLVRIFNPAAPVGSQLGPFIAATGLAAKVNQNENQNQDEDERHNRGRH